MARRRAEQFSTSRKTQLFLLGIVLPVHMGPRAKRAAPLELERHSKRSLYSLTQRRPRHKNASRSDGSTRNPAKKSQKSHSIDRMLAAVYWPHAPLLHHPWLLTMSFGSGASACEKERGKRTRGRRVRSKFDLPSWPPQLSAFSVPTHLEKNAQVYTPGVCLGRSASSKFRS